VKGSNKTNDFIVRKKNKQFLLSNLPIYKNVPIQLRLIIIVQCTVTFVDITLISSLIHRYCIHNMRINSNHNLTPRRQCNEHAVYIGNKILDNNTYKYIDKYTIKLLKYNIDLRRLMSCYYNLLIFC